MYSKDEHWQHILDAICYLADPNEKSRAHVTLRGPYPQKRSFPSASRKVEDADIVVTGVDAFFRPGQNTVFFSILAPEIERTWHKPDYPEYRPHLTISDGRSREFAEQLHSRLQELRPRFRFRASPLAPLVTTKGQGSLDLRTAYDEDLVTKLTGRHVPAEKVPELKANDRIDLIAALCSQLAGRGGRSAQETSQSRGAV